MSGSGPASYVIGGDDAAVDGQNSKHFFEDKIAQAALFQFKANEKLRWSNTVRTYLIGKCADAKPFLKWIEDRQHTEIDDEAIKECGVMMNVCPIVLSQRMWAFLSLCLQPDAEAMMIFNNVQPLNGAEVWRRIVVPINSRTLHTRHTMYQKVHSPARANKLSDLMRALEAWATNIRLY